MLARILQVKGIFSNKPNLKNFGAGGCVHANPSVLAPLKTVKAVGWHQELLQGKQMRRHDVRQALTSEFGVSSPSRGGRCKGVSLPFVLFAKLGRRRQFVVPLNVRIKLAIRLAVTTAALSKRRSPCRVMAMPIVSQCGPARVHFHDSWCRQDMGN